MLSVIEGLNPPQHEAVTADFGHILVLAGAGSGKTRVLVNRCAWLVNQQGLSVNQILAVTFTNKAAGEIKHRLQTLLEIPMAQAWVGTFHGLCYRMLRRHAEEAGLPMHFQILDSDDQSRLIKQLIQDKKLDEAQWPVKAVQSFINGKKEEGIRAKQVAPLPYGPSRIYASLYEAYEQRCKQAGFVDFSELLLKCCELFRDKPELLQTYHQQFKAILVDEFQDTNTIQYAWIRLLAGADTQVMVVGDDDQSIYGWRGAKVENIHQFEQDFPRVKLIRLEQNYRSTATILKAANALITHNASRLGKELWTTEEKGQKINLYAAFNEFDEARFVADRIDHLLLQGAKVSSIAILYRSNAQSRLLEEALVKKSITYRIHGGVRYFERAEIKDALAYLRLVVTVHDDTAFERVINTPVRGIGEKTIDHLKALAAQQKCSLWQAMEHALQDAEALSTRARHALAQFQQVVVRLHGIDSEQSLDQQIEQALELSGLFAHYLKMKTEEAQARVENLKELVNAAKQFYYEGTKEEDASWLLSFLSHAVLEAGERQAGEEDPAVHLMTLHAAKGLEFPVVFMVGVEEGVFPSKGSLEDPKRLEEERRLCYVGMTRAMTQLFMSYAEVRRQYGREEYHRASRFLKEIPDELLNVMRGDGQQVSYRSSVAVRQPARLQSQQATYSYDLGQQVSHPVFGEGIVLAYEGGGAHLRVQVQFGGDKGTKWLVVAYAKLACPTT